jgi:hypothetical protein
MNEVKKLEKSIEETIINIDDLKYQFEILEISNRVGV